jgi:formate hydrogenlyase subunit 3/multisubunit Na+/H+ antiporter MnhD subunit
MVLVINVLLLLLPLLVAGCFVNVSFPSAFTLPLREASMPGAFDWAMPWLLFFALNIGLAQFIFVFNFVKTLVRKPTKQEISEYDILHANPTAQGITAGAP